MNTNNSVTILKIEMNFFEVMYTVNLLYYYNLHNSIFFYYILFILLFYNVSLF